MHKNISVFPRLLTGIIDFGLFLGLIIINYYFLIVWQVKININHFYYFLFFSSIIAAILFIWIPLFFQARTIGMLILRTQFLPVKKEISTIKLVLKKAQLTFFMWLLLVIIFLITVRPDNFHEFSKYHQNFNYQDWSLNIGLRTISSLLGLWILLTFINLFSVIWSIKNLSLLDKLTETRLVWIKHFENKEKLENVKLIPYKKKNQEIIWHIKRSEDE